MRNNGTFRKHKLAFECSIVGGETFKWSIFLVFISEGHDYGFEEMIDVKGPNPEYICNNTCLLSMPQLTFIQGNKQRGMKCMRIWVTWGTAKAFYLEQIRRVKEKERDKTLSLTLLPNHPHNPNRFIIHLTNAEYKEHSLWQSHVPDYHGNCWMPGAVLPCHDQ